MKQSISSFAEQLLSEDLSKIEPGEVTGSMDDHFSPEPGQPDITKVKVPSTFMAQILNEDISEVESPPFTPEEVINEPDETSIKDIALRLYELIVEAKAVLSEMTTVGALGVNLAGPAKKKKKKKKRVKVNPWAICHSSVGKKKSTKFERCVKQIKLKHGLK